MLVEQLQTWLFNVLPTITILLLSSVITMMIRVLWHPEMWSLKQREITRSMRGAQVEGLEGSKFPTKDCTRLSLRWMCGRVE